MTKPVRAALGVAGVAVIIVALGAVAPTLVVSHGEGLQRAERAELDWPYYGGDQGGAKYSTLADVNTTNVAKLTRAWEWSTGEKNLERYGTRPGNFQTT